MILEKNKIRVAIVGVGNCASALVQGLHYYKTWGDEEEIPGVMFPNIGGYHPKDIEVVAAFDADIRKVGLPLHEAIFEEPNCARTFVSVIDLNNVDSPIVQAGPVFDGISTFMQNSPQHLGFRKISHCLNSDQIDTILKNSKVDIIINYLPVGSQIATEFWAETCIRNKIAFLNCIPVFIASNPEWEQKFIDAGIPLVGDDMKSQVGASILSQTLQEMLFDRGALVDFHSQVNMGFNTDFRNMEVKERLASKKISKENVIRSQHDIRGIEAKEGEIYAGPAAYVPRSSDEKVAYFDIRARGFGDFPIKIDVRLSVQDSENSAGVVVDAIRYLKVAKEMGIVGSLKGPSAWTQKSPPKQLRASEAIEQCEALANRDEEKLWEMNHWKNEDYVEVGDLPKEKAEQKIQELMKSPLDEYYEEEVEFTRKWDEYIKNNTPISKVNARELPLNDANGTMPYTSEWINDRNDFPEINSVEVKGAKILGDKKLKKIKRRDLL